MIYSEKRVHELDAIIIKKDAEIEKLREALMFIDSYRLFSPFGTEKATLKAIHNKSQGILNEK